MTVAVPEGFEAIDETRDNYARALGPIYRKPVGADRWVFGMRPEARHLNSGGIVHGGCLMSFADEMLGITVFHAGGRRRCATITLNCDFARAVREGEWLEGRPEIVRVTRSVVFIRGQLVVGEAVALTATGVWKILGEG